MNIQKMHYNPFSLTTAIESWNNKAQAIPSKLWKASSGAVYDIYVKNPYDLIVGNIKNLSNPNFTHTTLQKVAACSIIVFSILFVPILYGTTIHLMGKSIAALGTFSGLTALSNTGASVAKIGKNIFMVGAVPLYVLFYEGPKQIISNIPKFMKAVGERVAMAARWIFQNLLAPIWNKVIHPGLKLLGRACVKIADSITMAARWIFQNFLAPIWNKVIHPGLKLLGRACVKIGEGISHLINKVADTAVWLFKNTIVPLWNKVIHPALQLLGRVFVKIGKGVSQLISKVADTAVWLFKNTIVPLWNKVIHPALQLLGRVFVKIGNGVSQLINKVADAAVWLFKNALAPVGRFFAKVVSSIANAVATAAKFILHNIIKPACEGINQFVIKPLSRLISAVADKVAECFLIIYNTVLVPVAKALAAGFDSIKNKVFELRADIVNSFTSIWGLAGRVA